MPKVQEVVDSRGTTVRRKPVAGDLRWDVERWRRLAMPDVIVVDAVDQ